MTPESCYLYGKSDKATSHSRIVSINYWSFLRTVNETPKVFLYLTSQCLHMVYVMVFKIYTTMFSRLPFIVFYKAVKQYCSGKHRQ